MFGMSEMSVGGPEVCREDTRVMKQPAYGTRYILVVSNMHCSLLPFMSTKEHAPEDANVLRIC